MLPGCGSFGPSDQVSIMLLDGKGLPARKSLSPARQMA
jgi:hypothetical protein